MQRLAGWMASLGRFLIQSRGKRVFHSITFSRNMIILNGQRRQATLLGGTLYLYMAVTVKVVSSVFCVSRDINMSPIYYVIHVLNGPKELYNPLEKHLLNLVITARKLKLYFQAHPINVLTNVLLRQVLHKPDLSRRSSK